MKSNDNELARCTAFLALGACLALQATACGSSGDDRTQTQSTTSAGGFGTGGYEFAPGAGGIIPGAGGIIAAGGIVNQGNGGAAPPPPPPPPPPGGGPTIPPVTETCPDFRDGTITFMGLGGIQIVAGPKAPSPTAPMVFYWHGTGSTAGEFGIMARAVRDGVVQEGGVLVSFQGTTGGDLLSGTSIFGRGDFELTDQLLACAVRDHNIDPRRVFATGCSAGGLFSTAMAAIRSSYMAAAAPNSGGAVVPLQFENDHTPALMTIHGAPGRDVVVVDFSQTSATADQAFKARGGFVINCNHGGGHCGGAAEAPSIWQFFKDHPYGVNPEPYAGGLPPGFSSDCEIY